MVSSFPYVALKWFCLPRVWSLVRLRKISSYLLAEFFSLIWKVQFCLYCLSCLGFFLGFFLSPKPSDLPLRVVSNCLAFISLSQRILMLFFCHSSFVCRYSYLCFHSYIHSTSFRETPIFTDKSLVLSLQLFIL